MSKGSTRRRRKHARALRKEPTPGEQRLWFHLRNRSFHGAKFRRQYPIGPYIADFCCWEKKLIIEVDGDSHAGKEDQDRERQDWITSRGYRVIRFRESEVAGDLQAVLASIWCALEE